MRVHRCIRGHFLVNFIHEQCYIELVAEGVSDSRTEVSKGSFENKIAHHGSQHSRRDLLPELKVLALEIRQGHHNPVLCFGLVKQFLYLADGTPELLGLADLELSD